MSSPCYCYKQLKECVRCGRHCYWRALETAPNQPAIGQDPEANSHSRGGPDSGKVCPVTSVSLAVGLCIHHHGQDNCYEDCVAVLHLRREVLERSHPAEESISSFTADTDKLVELVHQWDEQHQQLYANKREAMLEHEGDSEVVPQWPPWSKGDLKESYISSLEKVRVCQPLHMGIVC